MRNRMIFKASLMMLVVCSATMQVSSNASAQASVDLSARGAIYFTGQETDPDKITQTKYVAAGRSIALTEADAYRTGRGLFYFKIGFYVFANGTPAQPFTVSIASGARTLARPQVSFAPNERTKLVRADLALPSGQTRLTMTIDADNQIAETNEANNTFDFTVHVGGASGQAGTDTSGDGRGSGRGEAGGGASGGGGSSTGDGGRSGRDALPDMMVKSIEPKSEFRFLVKVANVGGSPSQPCRLNAAIYAPDATGETFTWFDHRDIAPVAAGAEVSALFTTSSPIYGQRLTAYVFQCQHTEGRGAAENNRLTLQMPAAPAQPEKPPVDKPPVETPKISPDLAAVNIYYEGSQIVAVIKNVGDRHYLASGSNYKDSFARTLTLSRIKRVGAHSFTEKIESHEIPHVQRNDTIKFGIKRPKNDPASSEFRWQITISGVDPDNSNNTFTTNWEKTPKTVIIDE